MRMYLFLLYQILLFYLILRFRVQLSKLFINLVSDDDLHKQGSIYKLIISYIRQKNPNIVHINDDEGFRISLLFQINIYITGWKY